MQPEQPTQLEAGGTNALGKLLGLLGDEWTLLIIQQTFFGLTRYGQFKGALPISNSVLTARLRQLTQEGLLRQDLYQSSPLRAEYLITSRGRSLWPFLITIWDWERRWVPTRAQTLPRMVHKACGQEFAPIVSCAGCTEPASAGSVDICWGPSGSWERSVPQGSNRRRGESEHRAEQAGLFPQTMTILGNRWASALLGAAFLGVTRFTEFERALGAPPALIADRLRAFLAIGVLDTTQSPKRPDLVEYQLTEKGLAFFPVLAIAVHWGHRWFHAPEGPALRQLHRTCGEPFEAQLRCDRCAAVVTGRDVAAVTVPATAVSQP
jgi:DNA-binding HxlR family transcriptional regulator